MLLDLQNQPDLSSANSEQTEGLTSEKQPRSTLLEVERMQEPTTKTESQPKSDSHAEEFLVKGDRISRITVKRIRGLEDKLGNDGDAAGFYDSFRNAMETSLERSFARRIGE